MTYSSTVLADSPTVYWRLGETGGLGSATTLTDSTGNNNTSGAAFSGVGWGVTGPHTGVTAAQFYGGASGITAIAPATPATLSGSFTVELIAKNGTTGEVFGTRTPTDFGFDLALGTNGSGQNLHADIGTGTGWLTTSANTGFTWPATSWWHIAIVVTSTGWTTYVNGTQVGTGTYTAGTPLLWDASHKVQIGSNGISGDTKTNGTLAEVAVYNTALSSTRIGAHASAVGNVTSYASAVTADSPVAWWRLAGGVSAADTSGNGIYGVFTGSVTPATGLLTADASGAETLGSGTGTIITGPTVASTGTYSIEAWVQTTSATGGVIAQLSNRVPGDTSSGGAAYGRILGMTSGGLLAFDTLDSGGTRHEIKSTAAFNNGVRHHVVAVYQSGTGGGAYLYADGALVASDTTQTTVDGSFSGNGYWHVGQGLTTTYPLDAEISSTYFTGTVDEVAVYPSTLSASRVQAHYFAGVNATTAYQQAVLTDAPVRHYPINNGGFSDLGSQGRTAYGAGGLASVAGPTGDGTAGISFTTAGTIGATIEGLPTGASPWTIECLFWRSVAPGGSEQIFGWGQDGPTNGEVQLYLNGGTINCAGWGGGGIASGSWTTSTWTHVAATYDGTQIRLYIGGSLVATGAAVTMALVGGTSNEGNAALRLGNTATRGVNLTFGGRVAEAAIYGTALSAARISAHAAAVSGTAYKTTVLTDSPLRYYRLGETPTPSISDDSPSAVGATTLSDNYSRGYGNLAGDTSGTGMSSAAGLALPGSGLPSGNSAWTLETWTFVTGGTAGSGINPIVLAMGTAGTTNARAALYFNTNTSVALDTFNNSTVGVTLSTGRWHHLVGTYDGAGTTTLYVDGAAVATKAVGTLVIPTNPTFVLASETTGGNPFFLPQTQMAVYATALSPARVSTHYLTGLATLTGYDSVVLSDNPAFYWKMNEASGTTLVDASGNGRSGTTAGTLTYSQAGLTNDGGTGIKFTSSAYATTAVDTGQQTANRTVEMWVRAGSNITPTSGAIPVGMLSSDGVTAGLNVGQINAADDVWFRRCDASTNRVTASINGLSGATTLFDGKIHHVVETYDGAHIIVYIDGAQVASVAATGALGWSNVAGGFMLNGYSPDGTTRLVLTGWTYDNVAAYTTALSAARVSAHYTAGAPTSNPGRTGSTTYQTTVLADNPLLLWPLDETSGTSLADASGNGRTGSIFAGTATLGLAGLTADGGTSISMNSSTASRLTSVDPSMHTTSAISYELWTKEGSTATDGLGMLASGGLHAGMLFGQLTTTTNMEFRVALSSVFSSGVNIAPATYFGDGLRHHVVATYDGANLKVYVDGVSVGSTAVTGAVDYANDSNGLLLNDYFDGSTGHTLNGWGFDNFAVYGTALSASRVSAHFSAGNSPFGGTIVPSFVGSAAASQMQPLAGTIAPSLTGTAAAMVGLALSGTVQPLASWLVSTTLRNVIGGTINSPLIGLVTLGNSVNAIVAPDLSGLPVLPLPVDPNAPRAFRLNGTDLPPASLISYPVGNSRTWFARQSLLLVWRGLSVSAANMLLAYATATPATVDILMPSFRWNANVPVRLVTAGQADPAVLGLAGPGQGTLGVPANPPGMYNGVVVARLELLADIPILPPLVS